MRPLTFDMSSRGHTPEWVRSMEKKAKILRCLQRTMEEIWLGQQVPVEELRDFLVDQWHLRPVEARWVVQQLSDKS